MTILKKEESAPVKPMVKPKVTAPTNKNQEPPKKEKPAVKGEAPKEETKVIVVEKVESV